MPATATPGTMFPIEKELAVEAVEFEPQHGRAYQLDQWSDLQHLAADPVGEERAADRAADRGSDREGQVAEARLMRR